MEKRFSTKYVLVPVNVALEESGVQRQTSLELLALVRKPRNMATYYDELPETPEGVHPPFANLASAALFLAGVFESHNIPVAFLGGFAFGVLGNRRETSDVDVCVQSKFRTVRQVLEKEARYEIMFELRACLDALPDPQNVPSFGFSAESLMGYNDKAVFQKY